MSRSALSSLLLVLALARPDAARAFSYQTIISKPCHEKVSQHALRTIRKSYATAPVLPPSGDERAMIEDLPFDLDGDMRELAAAALVLAVRDVDLRGREPIDTTEIPILHGDPASQREHCLRHPGHDEPDGTSRSLADCRAFIREEALAALEGLLPDGTVNAADRVPLRVFLSLRGTIDVPLPRFYVRAGHALHTLQDSFTHTFRTADGLRVTTMLNWVEAVEGRLVEHRDGPTHKAGLDRCDDPDALFALRHGLARDASVELLAALLAPGATREARMAQIDDLLVRYLGEEPGCTFANRWCDAPELAYEDGFGCGCRVGRAGAGGGAAVALLLVGALVLRARRRGR